MPESEAFTFVPSLEDDSHRLYPAYHRAWSGKSSDLDVQLEAELRRLYPGLVVTTSLDINIPLLQFASAGHAEATLDVETESTVRWRQYRSAETRDGQPYLSDQRFFAKYHYQWANEDFILYVVRWGGPALQYTLKEPSYDETPSSGSKITDALLLAAGKWSDSIAGIFVYDYYWYKDTELYEEVQKASWDKVILDAYMKAKISAVADDFFNAEDVYDDYGVAWKRGIIFYGPAGNGKTISLKAIMHELAKGKKARVPSLYVKSATDTYDIRSVFYLAREMAPCLLIFEDIDTIVTEKTRAYFFNEVDGLEDNDGILMIATTNHLDELDPGLAKRPSRFDRKYLFDLPDQNERTLYCQYWGEKLQGKKNIEFPAKLCPAIAEITSGFSFAYMQEAFVATLLKLARDHTAGLATSLNKRFEAAGPGSGVKGNVELKAGDDLERYVLWRVIRQQVRILREEMEGQRSGQDARARVPLREAGEVCEKSSAQGTTRAGMVRWNDLRGTHGGRQERRLSYKAEALLGPAPRGNIRDSLPIIPQQVL